MNGKHNGNIRIKTKMSNVKERDHIKEVEQMENHMDWGDIEGKT